MPELMLCLLLLAVGGIVWSLRDNLNPAALWAWGWAILLGSQLFLRAAGGAHWTPGVSELLSPLLPAFMLAGALAYVDRPAPRWLLPSALLVGALRWTLTRTDLVVASHAIGAVVEPAVEAAAAGLILRATWRPGARTAQRLIGPAMVIVALLDGATAVSIAENGGLASSLAIAWWPVCLITLGLQITAAGHRQTELSHSLQREGDRARRALAASERRFEVLARHATDLITEMDANGRVTYMSPSVERMLGLDQGAVVGTAAVHWIHPDDRERALEELRDAGETGEPRVSAFRTRRGDGTWCWLEASVVGFTSVEGERRTVAVSRDVSKRHARQESLRLEHETLERRVEERTAQLREAVDELELEVKARREAEHALRTSRERYRIASELSSDYSYGLDVAPDGEATAVWVTDAFSRITGYAVEEMNELGWDTLLSEAHLDAARTLLTDTLAGRTVEFEGRITTKSGETRWLHSRVAARALDEDGVIRIMGASRDVTEEHRADDERRALEAHLSEVQRMESLGVLAGGIAHDFNNLLSVILGNAALGESDATADPSAAQRFARIRSAATHGAELTGQMLTYSGRTPFSVVPTDLSEIVAQTRELLEASIPRKGTLQLDIAPALPLVDGDDTQLRQVIVNLVTNAAEAVGDNAGHIRVTTDIEKVGAETLARTVGAADAAPGEYVVLSVEDTGGGMDEATRERIFDPFFTTRRAGRGLGLAAVLGIVRGHGGAIMLESEPGEGTRFRVFLPCSASIRAPVRAARKAQPVTRTRAVVLVVDDEEAVLEISAEFLARADFEVRRALGGREALERLEAEPDGIHAVVLDLVMPDLDGEETLRRLRRIAPDVPVILTSGYDEERASRRFAPGDVAAFVRKPYAPEELVAKVEEALSR